MRTSRARSNSSRAALAGDVQVRRSPRSGSLGAREATRLGECATTTSSREARARVVDAGLSSSRSLGDMGYGETGQGGERDRTDASGDLRLKSTQQLMQMIDRLQSRLLNIQARASEQHRLLVQAPHEPPADLPLGAHIASSSTVLGHVLIRERYSVNTRNIVLYCKYTPRLLSKYCKLYTTIFTLFVNCTNSSVDECEKRQRGGARRRRRHPQGAQARRANAVEARAAQGARGRRRRLEPAVEFARAQAP